MSACRWGWAKEVTKKEEKGKKINNFLRKLGQGGVFTLRECAPSISRIELPPIGSFLRKFFSHK
jgi:hypothetical protein